MNLHFKWKLIWGSDVHNPFFWDVRRLYFRYRTYVDQSKLMGREACATDGRWDYSESYSHDDAYAAEQGICPQFEHTPRAVLLAMWSPGGITPRRVSSKVETFLKFFSKYKNINFETFVPGLT